MQIDPVSKDEPRQRSKADRESSVQVMAPLASVYNGYTCTETDSFYWKSTQESGAGMSTSKLLKAYADNLPLEPRFDNKDTTIQYAVEGRKAKVMCHVYTHPHSDIKWYFREEKIMLDDRYSAAIYPSGLCVLEFENMNWTDAGEYIIRVQNPFGFATRSLLLKVSDPPTFLDTPKPSYSRNRLDEIRISCRVDGIPTPKVMFYRDWSRISSASRCKVREEGDTHSLMINGLLVRDSGSYQVVAENEAGRIHTTFNIIVEEGSKTDSLVAIKKYMLEDYYYLVEEISREERSVVYKVIEKSSGTQLHARIWTNPTPLDRNIAHKQMLAMQASSHENVIRLVNVIENQRQVVIMYEIVSTSWLEFLFLNISWSESYIAHYIKELLYLIQYLHNAYVALPNLQLTDIYYCRVSNKLKLDIYSAGWFLNTASHRSKYIGTKSMYCAPEVKSGEVTLVSDMWNVGVITYILLGGTPMVYRDGSINVDVNKLEDVGSEVKDFINKMLQRECSERTPVEEALKHNWLKTATQDMRGSMLDIANIRSFLNKMSEMPNLRGKDAEQESHDEAEVIKEQSTSDAEAAWLVDWFAKYKHDHDTYLIPVRELDLPLRLREYRRSKEVKEYGDIQELVDESLQEDVDYGWHSKTLRTREIGGSNDEAARVRLTRKDLLDIATQGLATIEKQAAEASGYAPNHTSPLIFRQKLQTQALKVSASVTLECEIEGDDYDMKGYWFRNDEIIMADIEKNTVLVSDRFTFSYAKDGKVTLVIRSAVPQDAGVYKCQIRCKKHGVASTKARLLVGDVPEFPGRPVVSRMWDTQAYLIWCEPSNDGNSPIRYYRVDYKAQDGERWVVCHYTQTTSAVVDGLMPCTIYRFRVSAVNDFGYSSYSWASPEARSLNQDAEPIMYTPFMKESITQSLTPPIEPGHAGAPSFKEGVSLPEQLAEGLLRSTFSDSMAPKDVNIQTSRAADLYRFSQDKILCFERGAMYSCQRKDTKQKYLATVRPLGEESVSELEVLRVLHHDHVERLVEVYEQPSHYILIYHKMSDETILHQLSRRSIYSERYVTDTMTQLCDAVEYLHHKNITHGAVHPYNLILSSRNGRRVLLANILRPAASVDVPEFTAPEILMEEGRSKSSDMWGIGLTAFILLSGRSPFYGGDESATKDNIQYLRFRLANIHPNCSQTAHKFIYNCLKRVPSNRADIAELVVHPWLDVGHHVHQKLDDTVFPTMDFYHLVTRLDAVKASRPAANESLVEW